MRTLYQIQLSNYDPCGKFLLTGDSNWQMAMTKLPYMLRAIPDLVIDILSPNFDDCIENPMERLRSDVPSDLLDRVNLIPVSIARNALRTRYDFNWNEYAAALRLTAKEYTNVYVNDPMLMRHLKALFYLEWKLSPKFIVQTHFLDSPINSVVPPEVSYWHGQVEAAVRADVCMWHCKAMQDVFLEAMSLDYSRRLINQVTDKSVVWKDGYSINEIRKPVNFNNVRFDWAKVKREIGDRKIVWVPNRVGGLNKSFDYTNNGKFLFEVVPKLWQSRRDFVVFAGNPNQKISNDEIESLCPAYHKLHSTALNRDEYRLLASSADVVVGLYLNDTNGGLASLEAIEHSAIPLFPDVYEYSTYFNAVDWPKDLRVDSQLENIVDVTSRVISVARTDQASKLHNSIREFIRGYAAYENTTAEMVDIFGGKG